MDFLRRLFRSRKNKEKSEEKQDSKSTVFSLQSDLLFENRDEFQILNMTESFPNLEYDRFLEQLHNFQLLNKLSFPNEDEIYSFDIEQLKYLDFIEITTRYMTKKFKHIPSGTMMAIKFTPIPFSRFNDPEFNMKFKKILREIDIVHKLNECPNIVYVYGLGINSGQICLCMELMDMSLGEMYTIIHEVEHRTFPEELIGFIAVRIVEALRFCKAKGIMHRDIKPSNILINRRGSIKLVNFGAGRILENSLASTYVGTIAYCPPEHFTISSDNFQYDIRSDIWSLGITLLESINGHHPFLMHKGKEIEMSRFEFGHYIVNLNPRELIQNSLQANFSHELYNFLSNCLEKVEHRPKLEQLIDNAFYRSYSNCKNEMIAESFARYKVCTIHSQSEDFNNDLSFLSQELRIADSTASDIHFIDSLYDELPSSMTNILKQRQCKIVFLPDDLKEYDFHKIEELNVLKTTHNVVEECIQLESRGRFALKSINIPRSRFPTEEQKEVEKKQVKKLLQEIQTHLSLLNSQNVVALYGFCACGVRLKLGMELMEMNVEDLYRLVHKNGKNFPEDLFACVGVSVINALEACGQNRIIHRDIKPSNVLLDKTGRIKLCDFGEARSMKDEEYFRTTAGTVYYLAPERLEDKDYDIRADIWSFGIMLAEIAYGKIPYLDKHGNIPQCIFAIHRCIKEATAEEIIERCIKPRKYTSVSEDLVRLCLAELINRPEKYEMLKNTSFYAHFSNVVNEGIVVGVLEKLKNSGLLKI